MPEVPDPENIEQPKPTERLTELATQFDDDLRTIRELKTAIKRRIVGDEAYALFELENAAEEPEGAEPTDTDLDQIIRADPSLNALAGDRNDGHVADLVGRIDYNLTPRESHYLEGGNVYYADDMGLMTKPEFYDTAIGESKVRYTEYIVRESAIVARLNDTQESEDYSEQQRQIDLETAAGINGRPVSLPEAERLAHMLRRYMGDLEQLLALDDGALKQALNLEE